MTKVGLVFSGGGGKGAYEIGVWKALKEYGIDVNVKAVAGTSVGGLNGALFVAGDYQAAEQLWLDIAPSKVLTLRKEDIAKALAKIALASAFPGVLPKTLLTLSTLLGGKGAFSQDGLAELIKSSKVCESISKESLPFQICALTAKSGKLVYPLLNELSAEEKRQWLLATSAIPVVFPSIEINKVKYADGGVLPRPLSDNTPYKPLIEQHNCTHIINVHLEREADTGVAKQQYPQINFWHIVPTQAFDGLIEPLNFTKENAESLIELGYQDTAKILQQFKAFQDDEQRYMEAVFNFSQANEKFVEQIQTNQILRGDTNTHDDFTQQLPVLPVEEVLTQLGKQIQKQERELINSNIDRLIDEMAENSNELLDEAFSSITALASTEGRINSQVEQGHLSRFVGAVTGSNAKLQAGINWDLNRAIYANQQLTQKLNHKQMLSMEAIVTIANKTNYLMTHVNVLYGSVTKLQQDFGHSLALMKQGIESLAQLCEQQFEQIELRLGRLERTQLLDDWYQQTKAKIEPLKSSNCGNNMAQSQLLLQVTSSFYNVMGRGWNNNELCRYVNLLDDLALAKPKLAVNSLFEPSNNTVFYESIGCANIFPIAPEKQSSYPILTGLQIVADTAQTNHVAELATKHIEKLGLSVSEKRTGRELGLELLHSLRCNDKRKAISTSSITIAADLEPKHHGKQALYLTVLDKIKNINDDLLTNKNISNDIKYLQQAVSDFKVVVPIIGKYSSGKSTLLNNYLGCDYLAHNITPETAFATELCFSEREYLLVHFTDNSPSIEKPLSDLANIEVTDTLYNVQAFVNNRLLKSRPNLVLVDMPGFDSNSIGHHKAIANYLAKGDVFVNLLAANLSFDGSIMSHLQEISLTYNKNIVNLLSKSGLVPQSKLAEIKTQLEQHLSHQLEQPIILGSVESKGRNKNLTDFSTAIDNALCQHPELLKQRYQSQVLKTISHCQQQLQGLKNTAQSGEVQLKEQINQADIAFEKAEKRINSTLNDIQNNLMSIGKEQLTNQAQTVLSGATSSLVSAAKANQVAEKITALLRPVLQRAADNIIAEQIATLEQKLDDINSQEFSQQPIALNIPAEEKEIFSLTYAAIGAGVATIFFGPVGIAITSMFGGLFGRKDNAEERDQQIRAHIQNQVIPQAINQAVDHITNNFNQVFMQIKQVVTQAFEQEKDNHHQQMEKLTKQLQLSKEQFTQQQQNYNNALNSCVEQTQIIAENAPLVIEPVNEVLTKPIASPAVPL